jgi:hypothetical protein
LISSNIVSPSCGAADIDRGIKRKVVIRTKQINRSLVIFAPEL